MAALLDEEDRILAELLERARAREDEAERELHERFAPFLRRRLAEARSRRNWFWLTDLDAASQEVFSQFFNSLRDGKYAFEGKRRLEGYLLRTAFFVAMNHKNKATAIRTISIHDEEEGGLRFDVSAYAEAVYDGLERQDCLRLLARAVARLNPNRRDVVERTLLGQKVRDICQASGRTPASVSGLKFNALVQLRKILTEVGFLERCGELFQLSREASND